MQPILNKFQICIFSINKICCNARTSGPTANNLYKIKKSMAAAGQAIVSMSQHRK